MEPFENNEFENHTPAPVPPEPELPQFEYEPLPEETPQYEPPVQPNPYHGAGAGRKESPYANSPYVMNQQPHPGYQYQPQTEPSQKVKKVKPPKKQHKSLWKPIVAAVLTIALVAGGCLTTAICVNEYWEERTEDTVEMLTDKIEALEAQIGQTTTDGFSAFVPQGEGMSPSQLYQTSVDSVVAISTTIQTNSFYGPTQSSSSGSGFILTEDGYVVTNYHVVEGATAIEVTLHNDTTYPATLVGNDATNDIAVLKVEATGLPAAPLGSSSQLAIGDMVAAIGNPLGELASTQTIGYVSGVGREVTTDNTIISMIQTDAAINPGNSGGPLFNMYGQVIGITTAKYSGTTGSGATIEGIGFAIPIDDVLPIISDLIDYGYVTGAYMGVTVQNTDAESASMFGLPTGAYIVSVEAGGAAQRAGIQPKDIVINLGSHEVENITDLTRALRNFKAGDTTTVTLIRSGQEITLDITLDEKPRDTTASAQPEGQMPSDGNYEEWYDYFRRYFGE